MSTPTELKKLKRLTDATYIPLADIKVNRNERLRRNVKEVNENAERIADSIILVGPIQPLLLDEANNLIDGECRYTAYQLLQERGFNALEVPVVRRAKIEQAMKWMIELDANMQRKQMCWQDIALGIAAVHEQNSKMAADRKEQWGLRATGHLVNQSHSYVQDCIIIAKRLQQNDKEIWEAKNLEAAKQVMLLRKEQALTVAAAKLSGAIEVPQPKAPKPSGIINISLGDVTSPPPSVIATTPEAIRAMNIVNLSTRLHNVDCTTFMKETMSAESVDAIITDIPYGIDMDLLEDMQGIDMMRSTHDVDQNVEQMKPFLEGAYRVLKPDTYLFFFYAQQHQEKLATWGREVGFNVLDWNLLWLKPHSCKNNAPHQNPTKSYEPVMVMKKGKPVLAKPMTKCHLEVDGMPDKRLQANPFAKPLEFIDKMILDPILIPGMTILDPFAGEGSILRACILRGCKIIGCELDEQRFPALVNRVKETYKNMLGGNVQFT
jgi:DNA modification methylase/ParB-like chromosome segregation protein Spo0J